jgi:hypothetical protein
MSPTGSPPSPGITPGGKKCQLCGWWGVRTVREVNYCLVHKRDACAACFLSGRC